MQKIFINAPILSASGYGEMARFALRTLRKHESELDIYLNVLNWGQTGYLFDENEEYEYIKFLRVKTENYLKQTNGQPQFDISLQITIPNEWKRMAAVNIGYTAGIETDFISPAWFEPSQQMDKIIVISEHAKSSFLNTVFMDGNQNKLSVSTPIEVVHFPFPDLKNDLGGLSEWLKTIESTPVEDKKLDLKLKYDFNFLCVNQWGPRKNIEQLIKNFISEFRDEEVGLVIKSNCANDSIMDKHETEKRLLANIPEDKERKCKIYLIHGRLTDKEMHSLYRHEKIKAFVTTTHGEGFGLPIFEAMAAELPIIATDWSGHLDFLTVEDKKEAKKMFAKIDYQIKPIQPHHVWQGVMENGCSWAYPSDASIRTRMREVMKDYGRFKSWSKKLAAYNKEKFSEEKVENKFFSCLESFITKSEEKSDELIIL